MPDPRFAVGDLVRVRPPTGGTSKAVWRIERRDYWWTDTEPAYELRYGTGKAMHIRFAMQSDLELVNGSDERPTSAADVTARMTHQE